jgi:hypothetical protein
VAIEDLGRDFAGQPGFGRPSITGAIGATRDAARRGGTGLIGARPLRAGGGLVAITAAIVAFLTEEAPGGG